MRARALVCRFLTPTPRHYDLQEMPALRHAGYPDRSEHPGVTLKASRVYQMALDYIRAAHPHWDRHAGADHIFSMYHDEGACFAPAGIANATILTHWGRTTERPQSSTTFFMHHWSHDPAYLPALLGGTDRCFRPERDIVMPAYRSPPQLHRSALLNAHLRRLATQSGGGKLPSHLAATPEEDDNEDEGESRQHQPPKPPLFVLFRGAIRPDSPEYSFGIRHELFALLKEREAEGIVFSEGTSPDYRWELSHATFCLVLPGDGWSARLEDAVTNGCVPVIIQDEVLVALEGWLDVAKFSLRVARKDIPRLMHILRAVPHHEVARLKAGVGCRCVRPTSLSPPLQFIPPL